MPVHDRTRAAAGDFHDFHQCWMVRIADARNRGALPPGYMARLERTGEHRIPDGVTVQGRDSKEATEGGIVRIESLNDAKRVNRVVIRPGRGKVILTAMLG